MKRLLLVSWIFLLAIYSGYTFAAAKTFDLEVQSGETLSIDEYAANSETLLIWLPSERGFGDNLAPVFSQLAQSGLNIWAALLHDSYIIPPGRHSLDGIATEDLLTVLDEAKRRGFRDVFILGAYRSAAMALKLAYRWQQLNAGSQILKGLIFFTPNLTRPLQDLGEDTGFIDLTAYSNLPVYILQTEYSTKFARVGDLSRRLGEGGSPVFLQNLRGVINGYYMRPDDELSQQDRSMRSKLSVLVLQAIRRLRFTAPAPFKNSPVLRNEVIAGTAAKPQIAQLPGLRLFTGKQKKVALKLKNLQGQSFDLADYGGQVVLVNFWATWCAPCVEEMPSLSRLNDKMKGRPFKIVAVNIGENPQVIREFLKKIPANFEILLDSDSQAVRDWKVYAYPSNYVIDRQGDIRLAFRGALEWDSDDIITSLEPLF
jgi:thiol-disulfide isomerase/thioredoxin